MEKRLPSAVIGDAGPDRVNWSMSRSLPPAKMTVAPSSPSGSPRLPMQRQRHSRSAIRCAYASECFSGSASLEVHSASSHPTAAPTPPAPDACGGPTGCARRLAMAILYAACARGLPCCAEQSDGAELRHRDLVAVAGADNALFNFRPQVCWGVGMAALNSRHTEAQNQAMKNLTPLPFRQRAGVRSCSPLHPQPTILGPRAFRWTASEVRCERCGGRRHVVRRSGRDEEEASLMLPPSDEGRDADHDGWRRPMSAGLSAHIEEARDEDRVGACAIAISSAGFGLAGMGPACAQAVAALPRTAPMQRRVKDLDGTEGAEEAHENLPILSGGLFLIIGVQEHAASPAGVHPTFTFTWVRRSPWCL